MYNLEEKIDVLDIREKIMNRIKSRTLVIMASVGLAALAAGLAISLPKVMASNALSEQLSPMNASNPQLIPDSNMESDSPQPEGVISDSLYNEAVMLPPISTQSGMLLPDMIANPFEEQIPNDVTSFLQQHAQDNESKRAQTPTQEEAGEFAGINGSVCAYNNFTDTLAAAVNGDVIYIKQGTWVERIGTVNKNVTFAAANSTCTQLASGGVTIDGNDNAASVGGVIEVAANKNVTLSYLTLTNGTAISGGIAAINSGAGLVLNHSRLTDGYAYNGGAVFINGGRLTMNDSTIYSNTAQMYGGGIYANYGPSIAIQNNSQVISNLVSTYWGMGGGIYIGGNDGALTVTHSAVLSNTASYAGGIRMIGDNLVKLLDETELKYNHTIDGGGGALLSSGGTLVIDDAQIKHNTAVLEGGALWLGTCNVSISDTSIFSNTSDSYGGGIFIGNDSNVDIENSQIINNDAQYWGGGVFVASDVILNVNGNSHIDENKATDSTGIGGGVYISGNNSQITITASTVMSNAAPLSAGGIRLNGNSTLKLLDGMQVNANKVPGSAGGLAVSNGTAQIDDVTFTENSANSNGGAVWMDSGSLTIADSSLTENYSGDSGGGIFHSGGNLSLYAKNNTLDISNNDSKQEGGGIYDESGSDLIVQAKNGHQFSIEGNTANYGGGVYLNNGTDLQGEGDIDFLDNIAAISGGGIYVGTDASLSLHGSSMSAVPNLLSNRATNENGGAIYALNSAPLSLVGATIGSSSNGNTALKGRGGGLFIQNGTLNLIDVSFNDNQASGNGGAMALYTSTLVMESISDTITMMGAGVNAVADVVNFCDPDSLATDQYCSQFSNNTSSSGNGGAIYLNNSIATISNVAFMDNSANIGAAIYNYLSRLTLSQSRVSENESYSLINPSVIYVDGGSASGVDTVLNATHTTIAGNRGTAINYTLYTSGEFNNNIIWDNESRGEILPYATASCNNTQDRNLGGNNISVDPLFIETSRGKYHLPLFSPSVDVCTGSSHIDLDGYPRPQGTAYDMGAFEAMEPTLFLSVILR